MADDAEKGEQAEMVEKRKPKVRAKQAVGDTIDGVQGAFLKLGVCGTICCAVLFSIILGLAIPIAALVIGVIYKDDCKAEKYIPIYLIVAGAGGIISNILGTFFRPVKDGDNTPEWRRKTVEKAGCCGTCLNFLNSLLGIFLFIWFICGNVWVFRTYGERDNCDATVYWFAFVTIVIADAIFGLLLFGGLFACLCCCCCAILGQPK